MSKRLAKSILNSVRARPTGWQNEGFYQGLEDGHLTGIAIHYYYSDKLLDEAENLEELRAILGEKVSAEECKEFLRFVRKKLHVVIRNNFFTWISANTLQDFFDDRATEDFAELLPSFSKEFMTERAFWFPLRRVTGNVAGLNYFEVSNLPKIGRMTEAQLKDWIDKPLFSDATSWLKVVGRNKDVCEARAKCLISIVALCIHYSDRHTFVVARPPSGSLSSDGSIADTPPLFPSIIGDFEFSNDDRRWLSALDRTILEVGKVSIARKLIRSLRFYHSAWLSQYTERFALVCMALDALMPNGVKSGSAKCNWIAQFLELELNQEVLKKIISKLRGEVLHGDVVSLIESDVYIEFKQEFGVSPVLLIDEIYRLLVGRMLLGDELPTHRHPLNENPEYSAKYRQMMSNHGISGEFDDRFDIRPYLMPSNS